MKTFKREALDQAAHFGIAICICICLVLVLIPFRFVFVAICLTMGLVREVTEGGNILSPGSLRDLFFWGLGGFVFTISAM